MPRSSCGRKEVGDAKQEHHAAKQQNINQNPAQAAMQNFRYAFLITFGITIEGTVNQPKTALPVLFAFVQRRINVAHSAGVRIMANQLPTATIAETMVIEN